MLLSIENYKSPVVRDLIWAITSAPLMSSCISSECQWLPSGWFENLLDEDSAWLSVLDQDPSELTELITQQKDKRLGKYFETLWHFWLSKQSRYRIIENNVQIIIDGETLGELDVILLDTKTQQTLHWELAVKFYLGVGDTREMYNWHGPNLRDRMDLKVEHLLHKQSVISQRPQVRQWLASKGICIDQCSVILKGRLYLPWQNTNTENSEGGACAPISDRASLPALCSDEVATGWWIKQGQFEQYFDDEVRCLPLLNEGWMAKIPTNVEQRNLSKLGINETVSNKKIRLPLHIQVYNPRDYWGRAFLTSDNWPEKKI